MRVAASPDMLTGEVPDSAEAASSRSAGTGALGAARPWTWRALVAGGVLACAAARAAAGEPALGLAFLSVVPIAAAAIVLGRRAALLAAAAALALSVANEVVVDPSAELAGSARLVALGTRGVVFLGVALVVAELAARQRRVALALVARERDLAELAAVRDALTPRAIPVRPGLELGAAFTPAEGLVGGDFFLVAPAPGDATALVVGDVLGHGLEAAQRGAFVRAALGTFLPYERDPAQLLRLVNRALLDREYAEAEYVTAVCAIVGLGGELSWASAGHWPPWDLDAGEPLPTPGRCPPLGVTDDLACARASAVLRPGAGLLLFTDGLIEARAATGPRRRLGEGAARTELRRHAGRPPAAVARALERATLSFTGGTLADDLCLLAARRTQG